MNHEDRIGYLVLFCALLVARRSRASMADVLTALPEPGNAWFLARMIADADRSQETPGRF